MCRVARGISVGARPGGILGWLVLGFILQQTKGIT